MSGSDGILAGALTHSFALVMTAALIADQLSSSFSGAKGMAPMGLVPVSGLSGICYSAAEALPLTVLQMVSPIRETLAKGSGRRDVNYDEDMRRGWRKMNTSQCEQPRYFCTCPRYTGGTVSHIVYPGPAQAARSAINRSLLMTADLVVGSLLSRTKNSSAQFSVWPGVSL